MNDFEQLLNGLQLDLMLLVVNFSYDLGTTMTIYTTSKRFDE